MSRGNEPAYPVTVRSLSDDGNAFEIKRTKPGLTLREHFAGLALPVVIEHGKNDMRAPGESHQQYFARQAVACADALIAELEKTP